MDRPSVELQRSSSCIIRWVIHNSRACGSKRKPSLRLKLWGTTMATWRIRLPRSRSSNSGNHGKRASARKAQRRGSGHSASSLGSVASLGQSKFSSRTGPRSSSSARGRLLQTCRGERSRRRIIAALIWTGSIGWCDRPLRMMACSHAYGEEWNRLVLWLHEHCPDHARNLHCPRGGGPCRCSGSASFDQSLRGLIAIGGERRLGSGSSLRYKRASDPLR